MLSSEYLSHLDTELCSASDSHKEQPPFVSYCLTSPGAAGLATWSHADCFLSASIMAVARSLRRTNPITLVLAGLLTFGFLIFIFSSTDAGPALHVPGARQLLKSKDAASNALSPPSLPFFKSNLKAGEKAPPPPVVHYHMNNVTNTPDPVGNRMWWGQGL